MDLESKPAATANADNFQATGYVAPTLTGTTLTVTNLRTVCPTCGKCPTCGSTGSSWPYGFPAAGTIWCDAGGAQAACAHG